MKKNKTKDKISRDTMLKIVKGDSPMTIDPDQLDLLEKAITPAKNS